jgi:hypothetical protein
LRINQVGNCIRTKSPFADWSSDNYNVKNKKSAPTVIMKGPDLIKGGFTHPVREVGPAKMVTLHTCQISLNKRLAPHF